MSDFDLKAFQTEREEQRAKGFRQWKPTPAAVLSAYKEGERDLIRANLEGATLYGANLYGANLEGANLYGANLYGANGVKTVAPVGQSGRLIYAYIHEAQIHIQAGCRNGTPDEIRAAVEKDYASNLDGQADYMDAIDLLEKWGKRELARHAQVQP